MTDKDKALSLEQTLRLALEYVELVPDDRYNAEHIDQDALITAIKAALLSRSDGEAQTRSVVKDEPVVWNEGVPAMLPKQKEGETFIVSYEPKLEAKDEPWSPVSIGVDVTKEGAHVVGIYALDKDTSQIFYAKHHPAPQRTWVGLTDADIEQEFGFIDELLRDCVQRTEAKLKEKNT